MRPYNNMWNPVPVNPEHINKCRNIYSLCPFRWPVRSLPVRAITAATGNKNTHKHWWMRAATDADVWWQMLADREWWEKKKCENQGTIASHRQTHKVLWLHVLEAPPSAVCQHSPVNCSWADLIFWWTVRHIHTPSFVRLPFLWMKTHSCCFRLFSFMFDLVAHVATVAPNYDSCPSCFWHLCAAIQQHCWNIKTSTSRWCKVEMFIYINLSYYIFHVFIDVRFFADLRSVRSLNPPPHHHRNTG